MNAVPYILVLCIILGVIPTQAQTTETTTWDIQTCIAHAITHNIQIKQNSLLEQKSTLQWNQAKWEYAPSLQANASQTFSNNGKYSAIGMQSDMTLYNGNKTAQQIKLLENKHTMAIKNRRN
jgi:outer membrane protein